MGEYFLYLLFGILVVVIFAAVIIVLDRKYKKQLDEAMANIPKENLERIKLAKIVQQPENAKFYTTEGIILNVKNDNNFIKADVLFYNNFVGEYVTTKNVATQKRVKVGEIVNTVHSREKDFGIGKVREIK